MMSDGFTGGRVRMMATVVAAVGGWMAAVAVPARAVVIDTLTGTGNTSAPTDDPGWANVGALGIGTGVYLGNDWVLTAAHVGGGSIVLNGGTYAMLAGSGTTLTNNGVAGKSATADLYMFRLASTPPGLPGVTIASATATNGSSVTMIGSGRDRGSFTQWSVNQGTTPWTWTEVPSGGNAAGYKTLSSRSMRWGTNNVAASALWINDGFGDTFMFGTSFTDYGPATTEAQAAYGDSGGGVFHKNGSAWELAGIMLTVGGYSGQPDPGANAIYGDATYVADLSAYRSQIVTIVPEPASAALVVTAAGLAAAVRRRARSRRDRARR
ncbi:MAG: trypsin-like peptidase domain-containing protein [Planctomycetaceae bacterium]